MEIKEEVPRKLLIRLPARWAGPPGGEAASQIFKKNQNPGKWRHLIGKVINSQEGKFEVSDQEISQNASKLLQNASKCFKML